MRYVIVFTLFFLILVLYAIQAKLQHDLADTGFEIEALEEEIARLKIENDSLRYHVLTAYAYHTVYEKAISLGFIDTRKQYVLKYYETVHE